MKCPRFWVCYACSGTFCTTNPHPLPGLFSSRRFPIEFESNPCGNLPTRQSYLRVKQGRLEAVGSLPNTLSHQNLLVFDLPLESLLTCVLALREENLGKRGPGE